MRGEGSTNLPSTSLRLSATMLRDQLEVQAQNMAHTIQGLEALQGMCPHYNIEFYRESNDNLVRRCRDCYARFADRGDGPPLPIELEIHIPEGEDYEP